MERELCFDLGPDDVIATWEPLLHGEPDDASSGRLFLLLYLAWMLTGPGEVAALSALQQLDHHRWCAYRM